MRYPKVSIIIINYNGSEHTIECLESLKNQKYENFEVILVDNGSKENDLNQLKQFVENSNLNIKLIELKENIGLTGGGNIGVKYCKGEYIVSLQNDAVVDKYWLKNLVKPFSKYNKKLAAVGSLIKDYYNRGNGGYCGGSMNILGQVKALTKEESCFKKSLLIPGACFIIRKDVLKEIELLYCPEFFPAYYEDVDLSWRLYNLGYEILIVPDSIIFHKEGVTFKRKDLRLRKEINLIRNKYLTFYRNLPYIKFLLIFPVLIAWDFILLLRFLNIVKIKSVIIGIFEFFKNINKVKHIGNGDFSFLDKWRYH